MKLRFWLSLSLVSLLLFLPVLFASAEEEEGEQAKTGTFKVELPNGSYYMCHVPADYKSDGKTGAVLIMHGAGGTADGMLSSFVVSRVLEENNLIGIAPKSKGQSWEQRESTPMDSLKDAQKSYKIDAKRIHCFGYSAGGFFTGWVSFEYPEVFRTATIVAADLYMANMGNVKKYIQKPVHFIAGDQDPNADGARASYNNMIKMGAQFARLRIVPGQGHNNFPFHNEFPSLFKWIKACESGFDYPAALEAADKAIKGNKVDKAIEKVREIESHPEEDEFWKRLSAIREEIDDKGEKRLKSILATYKLKPPDCIKKLLEFEELYKGFPCAEKAAEERKAMEESSDK